NRAMPSRGGAYESRLRGADDLTRARPPSRSGDGSRPAVLNDDGRAASSAPIATPPVATASANRAVEAATSTSPRPVATGAASGAASRPAADSAASRPASSGRPASNGGTTSTTPATAPAPVGPWLVQLASFSNQANAQNLVARLRSDRFDAFARSVQIKGHTVYRVFVGPIKERAEADRLQKRLSDATRLKAIVVAAG
ncbi:MAG: SPOR domain-containing protein, partial [Gammaproteobacteria bacterium]|nr:SPOR domain-containing protein [Gammaproteobacteria bacterium]